MNKIEIPFSIIEQYFQKSQELLFDINNCHTINYKDYQSETFQSLNLDLLNSVKNQSIVYCIWVGDSYGELKPVYVGHAKHSVSKARLINHLCKKNEQTGAKLLKVKEALSLKRIIGFSYVVVEPDFMRKPIEDWIIFNKKEKLIWNTNN